MTSTGSTGSIEAAVRADRGVIRFLSWFLVGMAVAVGLHEWLIGPILASNNERLGYAATSALLLAWIGHKVRWRELLPLLQGVGIWVGLLGLLVLGYGFRPELSELKDRFLGSLIPQRGFGREAGSWRAFKSADGHFYLELQVNRTPVRFLVDTGASDVVLTRADAARAGLKPDTLAYTRPYATANGMTRGAPVVLEELRLGDLGLKRMPASVNAGELNTSLLGMAFFRRLDGYEVRGNLLTLRWHAGG